MDCCGKTDGTSLVTRGALKAAVRSIHGGLRQEKGFQAWTQQTSGGGITNVRQGMVPLETHESDKELC